MLDLHREDQNAIQAANVVRKPIANDKVAAAGHISDVLPKRCILNVLHEELLY
jgi:hypothetical protein